MSDADADADPVAVDPASPGASAPVWVGVALLSVGVGAGALAAVADPNTGGAWLVPAAVVVAWECVFLLRRRGLNHPPGEPAAVAGGVGVANAVTMARGLLYAGVAGFLLTGPLAGALAWAPALLYGAGAVLDAVDGALARRLGRRTVLGEKLDMGIDTLGFLVAPLVGVAWGRLPVWYLSLSAARYLFKLGRWRRRRRGLPVFDLPDSRVRRPLAAVQMAFIAVALAPVFPPSLVAGVAVAVLVPSLAVFARDYLVVAGHLDGGRAEGNGDAEGDTDADATSDAEVPGDADATGDATDPADD
ncbi:CDP-alcohol phosphatidyltransferase family protein [Halobaculum roseum]|uniref:CDP-alcohol phosphatidyltransferase family protein n=1 Tax=Halobaculum roseum TaxID=2175149 RepID=A0ABD5MJG7_9EURY|nr:CDP-alcohol phosphatidyltransferase family protein [Halobaculum roseum]QZY02372.1 CDP-alcohol phosphatidyltransferase family protein [Halobaculum roseum]